MAGRIVPPATKGLFGIVGAAMLTILVVFVALSWIAMLLGLTGLLPSFNVELRRAVVVFAFGICILCGALWFSAQVEIIKIDASVEGRIWQTLIAGLIAAMVGVATGLGDIAE